MPPRVLRIKSSVPMNGELDPVAEGPRSIISTVPKNAQERPGEDGTSLDERI